MKTLSCDDPEAFTELATELASSSRDPQVEHSVSEILATVKEQGDEALLALTQKYDGASLATSELRVSGEALAKAKESLDPSHREAIEASVASVRQFHANSKPTDWLGENPHGAIVGERHYPIDRVGIYVPGGSVPLVSTVIMTVTLARVAGVEEIVVTTPPQSNGEIASPLLAALSLCGVSEVYKVGGAQAIGALAYGTESIGAVDKIFGPGNAYVNEAKRQVFGVVGIDLLPGPSEVMVIADETANSDYVAAAILAQAEHGSGKEKLFLVSESEDMIQRSCQSMAKQIKSLRHRDVIQGTLDRGCYSIFAKNEESIIKVANFIAPEHLELQVDSTRIDKLTASITTAGAILQGHLTPTVLGDFAAGPSHVLPTGRGARFSSGLRLSDFLRRSSVVRYDRDSLAKAAPVIAAFSKMEQLDAHGQSLTLRLTNPKG